MKSVFLLTKVFFLSGFNPSQKKKNGKKTISGLRMMAYFGLAMFALSIAMNFLIGGVLLANGTAAQQAEYLTLMIATSALLTFVMSMFSMQNVLFKNNDYELLESLPVSKRAIVAAKIFSSFAINFFEDMIIALPAAVIYMVLSKNIVGGLLGIVAITIITFIPLLLTSIIGVVGALINAKTNKGGLVTTICSIVFFVLYFIGVTLLQNVNASQMGGLVHNVFLFQWIYDGVLGENCLNFLYFALICLFTALVCIFGLSLIYRPLCALLSSGAKHTVYKGEASESKKTVNSKNKVLLKKEWNFITKKPSYLINSYLGQVLLLVFSVFVIFGWKFFIKDQAITPEELEKAKTVFYLYVPVFGIIFNAMTTPSSVAVSLEGRECFELLNSYPLSPKDVIGAKLKMANIISLTVNLVVSTIVDVCFLVVGVYDPFILVSVYAYPLLTVLLINSIGMLTGLTFPKLDYENEMQVVKNSASVGLTLLFGFLFAIPTITGYSIFTIIGAFEANLTFLSYIGYALPLLILGIGYLIFHIVLTKSGENLYRKRFFN